jgi:glyoxylase-like metal-dependent hydrolase (beta-lactamase superfamily II)
MAGELEVLRFRHGPLWNFSYVVGVPGGEAVAVDPAWDVASMLAAAREAEMRIVAAVVTHGHRDHVRGLPELLAAVEAEVLAHEAEAGLMAEEFAGTVRFVSDGYELRVSSKTLVVVHTPGHTEGSLSLWGSGALLTGDTLMVSGPGRHERRPGAEEALRESLERRLAMVPGETLVYPGHDEGPEPYAELGRILGR